MFLIKFNYFLFIHLLLFAFQLVQSNQISSPDQINNLSHLNLKDFNYELEQYDYTLALFYSSDLNSSLAKIINKDAFIELRQQFRDKKLYMNYDKFVNFITIDCDDKNGFKLCNSYTIVDKPEWVIFRFGNLFNRINKIQDKIELLKLINNNIKSISIRFRSFKNLTQFIKQSNEPIVIGLFKDVNDKLSIDNWLNSIYKVKLNWNYKDILFCHIFKDYSNDSLNELEQHLGNKISINLPSIIIVRQKQMIHKLEKPFLIYKFSTDKEDLSEWIKRKIFGLIIWRSRDNEDLIKLPVVVAYFNFDFKRNHKLSYKWRNIMYDLALNNLDLNFALSNSNTFRKYLQSNKLDIDDTEPIFEIYDVFSYSYRYDDLYSEDKFNKFLNNFKTGNLEPIVSKTSSSSLTKNQDKILELTALTFSKYVANSKIDVFILLYAKNCEKCEFCKLAFEELSNRITADDQLLLAQIDGSENELPKIFEDINEYPAFFLFKPDENIIVKFSANFNLLSIIKFLAKHSTKELILFNRLGELRTLDEQNNLKLKFKEQKLNDLKNYVSSEIKTEL